MTAGEWTSQAKRRLELAGVESPALEAQVLAAHVLLVDRSFVLAHPDHAFPELAGEPILQRRERGEPLAYILGWREFHGRRFEVGPGVLIPRQETETLVEAALVLLDNAPESKVLDLGTGSGCIAITIKLERPLAIVTGSDVSAAALEFAHRNGERLGVSIRFVQSDLFGNLGDGMFDLIVSNPPYVGLDEALPTEVRDFEPPEALFFGHGGLEFYERLSQEAGLHLTASGRLMMEVGYWQASSVAGIFESCGWHVETVRRDLSGTDRVVVVQPVYA